MQEFNLGMIGGGTVGSGVFHALQVNGDLMASRIGVKTRVRKVAVKALDEPRPYDIPAELMCTDWKSVVNDPDIHLVTELVGGTGLAREVILTALKLGKPVVTANKALVSEHGEELFAAAKANNATLYYEASVCGGIPIIKALREGLVGNRINYMYGILNGTCNYILSRMKREGGDFEAVLADAQKLGYAETPPDLDVDGIDAEHKAGILASLAYGFWVNQSEIHVEGIRNITPLDTQFAEQLGYAIKLLGIIKQDSAKTQAGAPSVEVSVGPTLIPKSHPIASVEDVFNAVFVNGDIVGDTLFYGQGAGKDATASAVLSDLADAALDLKMGTKHRLPPFMPHAMKGAVMPYEKTRSGHYVRLNVVDTPGTLAAIAALFGEIKIGISSVIQPKGHEGESVPLIFMLHDAAHGDVQQALARIAQLPSVKAPPVSMRVESLD
jgi:homoserine dehydrogenase